MRALLLILLPSCASTASYESVPIGPTPLLAYDRVTVEGEQTIVVTRVGSGRAVEVGGGVYVAPRHVFPRGTRWLRTADAIFPVEEVRSGIDVFEQPTSVEDCVADWVVFRRGGGTPPPPYPVAVAPGDMATLVPSGAQCRVECVAPGFLAIEKGPTAPGWSGTPVAVHGRLIGFVQGMNETQALVLPLPGPALRSIPPR